MTRMQLAFTHELPVPLRHRVYTAIAGAPRILDHKWYFPGPGDTYYGCVVVVAVFAAMGEPISKTKIESIIRDGDIATEFGGILGMPKETVQVCWQEWDNMTPRARNKFVEYIRGLLAALPPESGAHAFVAAVPATVQRALVAASLTFAFLFGVGA